MTRLGVVALASWLVLIAAGACHAFDPGDSAPEAAEAGPDGTSPNVDAGTEPAPADAGGPLVGCDGPCTVAFSIDGVEPRELKYFPAANVIFATGWPDRIYQWQENAPDAAVAISIDPEPHDLGIKDPNLFWIANGDLRTNNAQCVPDAAKYLYTDRIYVDRADGLYEAKPVGVTTCTSITTGPTDARRTFAFVTDSAGTNAFRAAATADGGATILACVPDCRAGMAVVTDIGAVGALALDDARIYWTEGESTKQLVGVAPRTTTGGSATGSRVTDTGRTIQGLAAAGTRAYFTDEDQGELLTSAGGAPATVVMTGLDRPWGVAMSLKFVYIAEAGKSRVIRLPLPD